MRNGSRRKRSLTPPPVLERTSAANIPWTNIIGQGQRQAAERARHDGRGLVVILGPVDALILDLPDPVQRLPEQLEALPDASQDASESLKVLPISRVSRSES